MKINVQNKTPETSRLEFIKLEDVFGDVLIMRGWR